MTSRHAAGVLLIAALLGGCGRQPERVRTVDPAAARITAAKEQGRLSLLPALDAVRAERDAARSELDRLRAARAPVVRPAASRGVRRVSSVGGGCGQWTALLAAYPWPVDAAARVMRCESGCNPSARNPRSSARGLFQVLGGSLDPATNVHQAYAMWSRSGWVPWVCKP